jgi:hypothetical protein
MPDDWVTVLSAFASGIGSLAAAWFSVKVSRRRAKKDCDNRVNEIEKAIRIGAKLKQEDDPPT